MSRIARGRPSGKRVSAGDVMAGVTVALVLVPQSLAYTELAGLPPVRGIYAAAAACLAAAWFASSPYLQTGPVAVTALLTLGALGHLAPLGSPRYVALAGLLALVVGVVRLVLGALRLGGFAFMMSQPVVIGFSSGAALVILATQLPTALGTGPHGGVFASAASALAHPGHWDTASLMLAALTLVLMVGGRRIHIFFPGVLLAVVGATVWSALVDFDGATLGEVHSGLPPATLHLPYGDLPSLIIPGIIIAVVGFAEATSISRRYATLERQIWDPSQELVGQGLGNIAAGVCGGFPVGGSFSRTALNYTAGARTRWSGAVTGAVVALLVPFLHVLSPLPRPVLAAVVIGAVRNLVQLDPFRELWRYSKAQFSIALVTFVLTIAFAPQVGQAVLVGVLMAVVVHLRREILISVPSWTEGDAVHLQPKGVLYFGSVAGLERTFMAILHDHPRVSRLVVHLDGLGRVDVTGAMALSSLLSEAEEAGLSACIVDVPPQSARIIGRVLNGRWGL
jgi:SulP family sulfate permease